MEHIYPLTETFIWWAAWSVPYFVWYIKVRPKEMARAPIEPLHIHFAYLAVSAIVPVLLEFRPFTGWG